MKPHPKALRSGSENVLAGMQTILATTDARGILTGWSAGAQQLLGFRGDEVLGVPAARLLGDCGPVVRPIVHASTSWRGKVALRHRDGHQVEGELLANRQFGEFRAGWILIWGAAGRTSEAEDEEFVRRCFAQAPCMLLIFNTELRVVRANEDMERSLGLTTDQMRGLRGPQCFPHPESEVIESLIRQVVETGERRHCEPFVRVPGETRAHAWRISIAPLLDPTGRLCGASLLAQDTTQEIESRRRLKVLNLAGLRIGTTLDVSRTADELAQVATDHFADDVFVDLLDGVLRNEEIARAPSGEAVVCRRVAQRSVLPDCPEAVPGLGALHSYPENSPAGRTLSTGRGLLQQVDEAALRSWAAHDPLQARRIRSHGVHSVMAVPLRARGVTLGLAFLARHRTPEPFDEQDLGLAEELAARAALYIDNARQYSREREIALALQSSLLPNRAPRQAAVEVASRYLPAEPGADIGGDWFDVIPLSGARVALVVGDVVGRGIQASATMGRLCTAVRTLAEVDLAPDELLTQLDDLVLRLDRMDESAAEVGATCLYAVYDPVSRRCTMARAGHPVPAVTRADRTVEFLDLPAGPPLGLGGLPFEVAEVELSEGSLLALYTNGLIETSYRDPEDARSLLLDILRDADRPLDEICDRVLDALSTDLRTDDVALLLARTRVFGADQVATWDLPDDLATVARARQLAGERLAAWDLGEEVVFTTELVVSELVTNAIRYGAPPIQLRLIRDTTLICEVFDASSTAPHMRHARVFDEGGRGLLLVAQFAQRWGSRHTRAGKTIWAEVSLDGETAGLAEGVS
ncbi:SpoIIE family protein phosphatase [Streptomyces sp. NPDC090075]|uniref:SpoIIE family protein phosphatase n=1 Tax=Streptomyces sp. NPDC090075 TaxID=3365937 RepID=UPI0038052140